MTNRRFALPAAAALLLLPLFPVPWAAADSWKPSSGSYVVTRDGATLWKESVVVEAGNDGGVRVRAFIRGSQVEDIEKLESTLEFDAEGSLLSASVAGLAGDPAKRGFEHDLAAFSRGLNPATVEFGTKESKVSTILRNTKYDKKEKVARPDLFLYKPFLHYYAIPVLLGTAPADETPVACPAVVLWPWAPFPWMWSVPEFRTGAGRDLMEGSAHTMAIDSFFDEKTLEAVACTIVRRGKQTTEAGTGTVTVTHYELTLPGYVVNVYADADGTVREIYIPSEKVRMSKAGGK